MPIVTFTSDFGLKDYFVAIIKGAMLCENESLNIIDISHNVKNYDIVQAAYIIKNAYHAFPKGTIHVISVNDFNSKRKCFLAARKNGHYFICPDNGILSLIFEQPLKDVYELEYWKSSSFPLKGVYARAVAHIAAGKPFNEIGLPAENVVRKISIQPVISKDQIRGSVIHIDNFENVVLNISKDTFERNWGNRPFNLYFKRHNPITKLSRAYNDVPVGETLCLFNSANCLEIAINMGKAGSMLGLNLEDGVQIDFESEGDYDFK